jgi:cell division septation protein DedD
MYLAKLKNEYPSSPYINVADRSIPEEKIEVELADNAKKEVAAAQPVERSENKEEYKFTVQAGAFLNYKNAVRLKKNFQKSGYFSSVYPKEVGGSILNVVIAGKFKTESAAKAFLPKLKAKYKLNGRVIPYKG